MSTLEAAPVLSTPDTHILEHSVETAIPTDKPRSDDELRIIYDIERTLREIKVGKWKRIALQFPDGMLPDAPRVFQLLSNGLQTVNGGEAAPAGDQQVEACCGTDTASSCCSGADEVACQMSSGLKIDEQSEKRPEKEEEPQLFILGDTSYGECCVDEVTAEHIGADVVVHYGRSCLSPTARLPVIYVFTHRNLDLEPVVAAFKETYPDKQAKVVVAADVTYQDHVEPLVTRLIEAEGYTNVFATSILHNPSSPIPNRTIPPSVEEDPESLSEWQLFHISDPPNALLLTLSSRVSSIHIYPTDQEVTKPIEASTAAALRRRYAMLTKLSTVPIFGILINTLSVKNYLHIVDLVKQRIEAAGKKSYMFVVGKLDAAKVANFSEIGGWVVIGCWESSLVDSKDFWKPVITPYELELALQGDAQRVWTGSWRSDYQSLLDAEKEAKEREQAGEVDGQADKRQEGDEGNEDDSEEESAPPDFDLRMGRYVSVSNTRPMQQSLNHASINGSGEQPGVASSSSKSLTKRAGTEIASIKGVVSPAAEFLRSQRTWRGLGSDFDIAYEEDDENATEPPTTIVEGRSGIARGYTGADGERR
ncbi:Diphthamide biosynthesis protein 2 [Ascosphaera atra]|nr:Diphthamide biosynthesis protein 2 [Ascosphaera atra]